MRWGGMGGEGGWVAAAMFEANGQQTTSAGYCESHKEDNIICCGWVASPLHPRGVIPDSAWVYTRREIDKSYHSVGKYIQT